METATGRPMEISHTKRAKDLFLRLRCFSDYECGRHEVPGGQKNKSVALKREDNFSFHSLKGTSVPIFTGIFFHFSKAA